MVDAQELIYPEGHLGLLPELGLSLEIIFYCAGLPFLYRRYRQLPQSRR